MFFLHCAFLLLLLLLLLLLHLPPSPPVSLLLRLETLFREEDRLL
jgi:hypothetical protein